MSKTEPYSLVDGTEKPEGNFRVFVDDKPFCEIVGSSTDPLGALRVVMALNLYEKYEGWKKAKEEESWAVEERLHRVCHDVLHVYEDTLQVAPEEEFPF